MGWGGKKASNDINKAIESFLGIVCIIELSTIAKQKWSGSRPAALQDQASPAHEGTQIFGPGDRLPGTILGLDACTCRQKRGEKTHLDPVCILAVTHQTLLEGQGR